MRKFLLFSFSLWNACLLAQAQKKNTTAPEKCATTRHLEQFFQTNPSQRERFQATQKTLSRLAAQRQNQRLLRTEAVLNIPVVFHILLPNPEVVTDAQILAQLDTLNKDFFGTNGDSVRIPTHFKPFFGKSVIQFCLAQCTPEGDETTGIIRKSTSTATFDAGYNDMKHASMGGANAWDPDAYLNVWVCALTDNVLGFATFPNTGDPEDQGVVIDPGSLPGGSSFPYNAGKTLVHETGHYFSLFHIWGDDFGQCSGSDYVDDTPNQSDATTGCQSGIRTDDCTTTGNGIMYQNYMDYSYDECQVMFTKDQMSRMETSLVLNRPTLLTSKGCQPVIRRAYDVQMRTINSPAQRLCTTNFAPAVTFRNRGSQTLTTLSLQAKIDNGPVSTTTWTGQLASAETAGVTLNNLTAPVGKHILTVYTSNPNGNADEDSENDTLRIAFQYYPPVAAFREGFENAAFPPEGWDVVNPDGKITWERVTSAAEPGIGSVMINNAGYDNIRQKDDLRSPQFNVPATVDSAFFSFQIAAAVYSDPATPNNNWDTLEVLISDNCGQTYTSLYKKWGANLITHNTEVVDAFVPTAGDWRKDSINLGAYIGKSNLLLTFRNTTGFENNIYLDDISLRTVTVNPNLKAKGYLVTPSPTSGQLTVQFYPQPSGLRGIQLFNAMGQKVAEVNIGNGQANNLYTFDLTRYAPGTYYVRAVFADRVVIEKVIKF